MNDLDKNRGIDTLNRIMETELAGVVRLRPTVVAFGAKLVHRRCHRDDDLSERRLS